MYNELEKTVNIKEELTRYVNFWPWYLTTFIITFLSIYTFLRYADYKYESRAKIEIIDKAQDSEMSLPTSMTIFNRSMINLENEIGILNSFELHSRVVAKYNYNLKYYSVGAIKSIEKEKNEWFDNFEINFLIDTDTIMSKSSYEIEVEKNILKIDHFDKNSNLVKSYSFDGLSNKNYDHELPFEIKIIDSETNYSSKRSLELHPVDKITESFRKSIVLNQTSENSDQLLISIIHSNLNIANNYINDLITEFDLDGISDRQLVFKRTIDFVDSRFDLISSDLENIENNRKKFKEQNNITDLESNATFNFSQQLKYDTDLFNTTSQLDLCKIIESSLINKDFQLVPVDIGIQNENINGLINNYNNLILQREKLLISAGDRNNLIINLNKQISKLSNNLNESIDNYKNSLEQTIKNIENKENEFNNFYKNVPDNEKILRSIERELNIKEALFLLLLQKREEAAINFAVVKPSIKVVDYARGSSNPVSPNSLLYYLLSVFISLTLPTLFLFIRFILDTKIHTREHLKNIPDSVPIIGEIPFESNSMNLTKIVDNSSRNPLSEAIRMIIANLNFVLFDNKQNKNNLILVTSSIKGEGKTIVSTNIASTLSSKYEKVLLIGADLRNPQIHKFIGKDKSQKGLSEILYKNDVDWRDALIKVGNLDIILSGAIPPNPTQLLSSTKFSDFISSVKKRYDYVVIDSAPCLLVSDTFEISKFVDTTIYVVRSNHTDKKLLDFINESHENKKIKGLSIVLNGIGTSSHYGYSYGYQYGYQYGYKYGYNYGYGYGYAEDKN